MPENKTRIVELVAPAGTPDKLRIAISYGADAVYLSGQEFGLRKRAGNFTPEDLNEAVEYAHQHGKRVYLTLNIFAHNRHIEGIREYCREINRADVDAVIVSDPGVFSIVKELLPETRIHISTQANTTNGESVKFWEELGAGRVVLARELSFEEISEIAQGNSIELEVFVHGSMCISYSGRCLLSSFLVQRGANLGDCAHPCRWEYHLHETQRPDGPITVEEDEEYTYLMNSRDLCMIEHIPELFSAGITAFKIEGRMKSAYYVALATRLYREAIDRYNADPDSYTCNPEWVKELARTTTKGYTTGFFFGNPMEKGQIYERNRLPVDQSFLGIVTRAERDDGLVEVQAKNKITPGMQVVCISQKRSDDRAVTISQLLDDKMNPIEKTNPNQTVLARLSDKVKDLEMLRKA